MTILYVLDPATIGGATKAFLSLVKKIKSMGVTPIVCSSQYSALNVELESLGIQTIVTGHKEMITSKRKGGIRARLSNLKKFIKYIYFDYRAIKIVSHSVDMRTIDIIHTNSTRSDIGFFLARKYHKPHIVHIREFGDIDYQCYPLNPFYIKLYNKHSTSFICVSDAVRSHWIKKGIDENKAITIYDGIDFEKVAVSKDEAKFNQQLRLLMSGGIMPSKGQYLAIKAVGLLPDEVKKNITLSFIGWCTDKYKAELEDLSIKSKLINPVDFLGVRNDVLSMLNKYDVGLMCSKSEGFGLVTAEFMFARLGVIASNSGASPELIENGVSGLAFTSGNEKSLSESILKYYNDRSLLIKHSNAARERALENFTSQLNADNIYKKYMEVYSNH